MSEDDAPATASPRRTLAELGGTLSVQRRPAGGTRVTAGPPLDETDAA